MRDDRSSGRAAARITASVAGAAAGSLVYGTLDPNVAAAVLAASITGGIFAVGPAVVSASVEPRDRSWPAYAMASGVAAAPIAWSIGRVVRSHLGPEAIVRLGARDGALVAAVAGALFALVMVTSSLAARRPAARRNIVIAGGLAGLRAGVAMALAAGAIFAIDASRASTSAVGVSVSRLGEIAIFGILSAGALVVLGALSAAPITIGFIVGERLADRWWPPGAAEAHS